MLLDTFDLERDLEHNRKAKLRATRKALTSCDRCEGFGTLIALFTEVDCDRCSGLGLSLRLVN